jgi:signal transduction histidine kinase
VLGDRDRISQVFENLLGNAIKFTPAGGRITVGAAAKEAEVVFLGGRHRLRHLAEGFPHVFDRFWQARKGTRQGAGLGLPITRGIVEAHGGRIWVESTLGRGSTSSSAFPRPRPRARSARRRLNLRAVAGEARQWLM